jgi:hypothetical protein
VEDGEHHAEHRRPCHGGTEQQLEDEGRHREIGNEKPDRQEQQIEPVGLGVVIVMQPVLQFTNEGKA